VTPRSIIGIAGASCSGKSVLAQRLAERLDDARIVPLDAYYREPAHGNFDHPGALDAELLIDHVAKLSEGSAVDRPLYDFTSHRRRGTERCEPGATLIIEGLYALYWQRLRRRMGAKLFLSVDDEVGLQRRIERDTRTRGRTERSVREQFARAVLPMYREHVEPTRRWADLVLRGEESLETNLARVLEWVGR